MSFAIGLIAAPRSSDKTGGFSHSRGIHQFTGHTAVYIKQGKEEIVEGLYPGGTGRNIILRIIDIFRALFFGATVCGGWSNDSALLKDNLAKKFTIQITKEVAEKFREYFDIVKNEITNYTLRPHKEVAFSDAFYKTNCVHAALLVLVNFFEESNEISSEDKKRLGDIIFNLQTTQQGHLMQALQKIEDDSTILEK